MSPDPPHVVETERVQGPLTLSETRTWPEAPNWLNQPTRRSPACTGSVKGRLYDDTWDPVEAAAPWTNSGDAAGGVAVPSWEPAALEVMSSSNDAPFVDCARDV